MLRVLRFVTDILQDPQKRRHCKILAISQVARQASLRSTRMHNDECMKKMPRAYNPSDEERLIPERTRTFGPNVLEGGNLLGLQAVQVRPEVVVLKRNFRIVLLRRASHFD